MENGLGGRQVFLQRDGKGSYYISPSKHDCDLNNLGDIQK